MKRLVVLVLLASPLGATDYWIDPDWTGTESGTQAEPWASLSTSAWTTINAELASNPVTVYFSAREAGSDVNEVTTGNINLNRTDTGTNRLTIDGISQWNSDDATPSWSAYSGSARHQIDTGTIRTNNYGSPWTRRFNITFRGFDARGIASGQSANIANTENFILEDMILSNPVGATVGPTVILDWYNATNSGEADKYSDNLIFRDSTIQNSFGECVYLDGHKTQPSEGGTSADTVLFENLTISTCGLRGGEGDCFDIKDGVSNLTIRGNTCTSPTHNSLVTDSGESLVVERNFFVGGQTAGSADACISLQGIETTLDNRNNAVLINNMLIDCGSGGAKDGILITGPWKTLTVAFNTFVDFGDDGVAVNGTAMEFSSWVLKGNIIWKTSAGAGEWMLFVPSGGSAPGTHVDNLYCSDATCSGDLVSISGTTYTSATLVSSFEASALVEDPDVADDTGTTDTDYQLTSASPCVDYSTAIAGYTGDYFGVTRGSAWACGAAEFAPAIRGVTLQGVSVGAP